MSSSQCLEARLSVEKFVGQHERRHQQQTIIAGSGELTREAVDALSYDIRQREQARLLSIAALQPVRAAVDGDRRLPHSAPAHRSACPRTAARLIVRSR